jgi:hypothetical protein
MEEAIKVVNLTNNFVFVDLKLSEDDKKIIDILNIKCKKIYNNFGSFYNLEDELISFFKDVGDNNNECIDGIIKIIIKIVFNVIKSSNKETGWITIRTYFPDDSFEIPRWHIDGYYYKPYNGFNLKFLTTLKGDQTLIYDADKFLRKQYYDNFEDRNHLNKIFDINKSTCLQYGEGVFILTGDKNNATIHSEPCIKNERLFLSIVLGNISEINELYSNWYT